MSPCNPRLPLATFEIVQAEYARLYQLAPDLAEAVAAEIGGHTPTPPPRSRCRELLDELEEIDDEIAELESRRREVEAELAQERKELGAYQPNGDDPWGWRVDVRQQAEILLAQLRQYEGLEPEALVRVVHPEAVAT